MRPLSLLHAVGSLGAVRVTVASLSIFKTDTDDIAEVALALVGVLAGTTWVQVLIDTRHWLADCTLPQHGHVGGFRSYRW